MSGAPRSSSLPPSRVERTAVLSADGRYRYELRREWGNGPLMCWVLLNPSTADQTADDPTTRRCTAFARRERMAGIVVLNLFALRSVSPKRLYTDPEPEGPDNLRAWRSALGDERIERLVCAWGAGYDGRAPRSRALAAHQAHLDQAAALGWTRSGMPRHPLYVGGATTLTPFRRATA